MAVVKIKTGHSEAKTEKSAINEAVRNTLKEMKSEDLSFVVLFASSRYNSKKLIAEYNLIDKLKGVPMIGCTTAGEMNEAKFSRGGLTFFALASKYVRASAVMIDNLSKDPFRAGREAAVRAFKGLDIEFNLAATAFLKKDPTMMVNFKPIIFIPLLDGLFSKPEEAMRGILNTGGSFTPIIGGVAGDDAKFKKTYQFCNGKATTDSLALLAINSDLKIGFGFSHGYTPTKKKAIVTKAEGRFVYRINNKPAFEEYAKLIGISKNELKKNWMDYSVKYPFAVIETDKSGYLMKYAMSIKGNSLNFAADVPQDSPIVLMNSNKESIVKASKQAVKEAIKNSGSEKIAGAIVFDCICRGLVIGDDGAQKQVKLMKNELKAPFVGFETYGEEGYFGLKYGSTVHHNETILVIVFGEEVIAQT